MCLGVPMQIQSIEGFQAHCEAKGIERDVSLFMIQDVEVRPGDYVLVHVGYAIQKLEPEEAAATWQVLDELFESTELEEAEGRGPTDGSGGERLR
ncbi:MAG: HypC/HybG/HupF family hydrogenase formation chaperone [Candidatus Eisenbacteria bacterium]